jgi:hypothetical protein
VARLVTCSGDQDITPEFFSKPSSMSWKLAGEADIDGTK